MMTFRRNEDIASDMMEMVVLSRSVVGVRGIEKGKKIGRDGERVVWTVGW
jgi:hypothetical protein